MHPLDGPRLKLSRAEKHLNTIKAEINGFITKNSYTFTVEANPTPPNYVIVVKGKQITPDKELGVIIGDFAHNARSALDLLISQLSGFAPDARERFNLQFPIFDTIKEYGNHTKSYLAMVAPEHVTIIEGFQPYKRMDGVDKDALGILRAINDADKHRIIHVVGTITSFSGLVFSGSGKIGSNTMIGPGTHMKLGGPGVRVNFGNSFTYASVGDGIITKDRTVVAEVTSITPLQVNMQPEIQILVKFGEGSARVEGRPVMDTLTFIYDRVKEVIGNFEQFFPT